ncbi:MAG: hypothetical protein NZ527_05525 [Hydrogenobacter thermophilus]|uniref:hypothetical protein n=1 Tax=Hydrogenobacter thermophilus TaxID=940 RepID=UPI0030F4C541|nr:hypothetical protein [Hydrogenobacter thermophilus]
METLNKLPAWQRYTLVLGLPAILMVYAYFFFVSPLREEVSKLRGEREKTQQEIQTIQRSMNPKILENLRKKEEETKKLVEEKERELETIVGSIPTEKDASFILRDIGLLAKRSGLVITNLQIGSKQETAYVLEPVGDQRLVRELQPKPQQEQAKGKKQEKAKEEGVKYIKADVKITLLGTYPAFEKFMEGLSKGGITSYPSSLQISQAEQGRLRGELNIFVLVKKEEGK